MSHAPRRRFSQNFLIDEAIIGSIVAAIAPRADDTLVEIGPGRGALTAPLAARVDRLHVIEIDRDLAAALRTRYADGRVVVHEGDALEFDFAALGPQVRVVGNLPYHISTPILFRLVAFAPVLLDAHVMLQNEVVERMIAPPGDSEYSRLSVMLQYHFDMEKLIDVPPECFYPAPKVDSAVARLQPRAQPLQAQDETVLEMVVAAAFSQRRKTLRNTLGRLLTGEDFEALGVDPGARAQTLPVATYVAIADRIAGRKDTRA